MTHTLHREGSIESLKKDFTIIVRPEKGVNSKGSSDKIKKALDLLIKNKANNFGIIYKGNKYSVSINEIYRSIKEGENLNGVFSRKENLINFLKDIKREDLGLSVVVQGLFAEVKDCCKKAGLKIHTTNHSLGVWGDKNKLPQAYLRNISTMCGHGMVTTNLINSVIGNIHKGKITIEQGANILAKPCLCGVFNTDRAKLLLKDLIKNNQ